MNNSYNLLTLWERNFSKCTFDYQHLFLSHTFYGFPDEFDLQEVSYDVLSTLTNRKLDKLLIDASQFQFSNTSFKYWLTQNWFSQAREAGLRHVAWVVSTENVIDIMELVEESLEGIVNVQYFDSEAKGRTWLAGIES
ncbi:hypothetical protein AAG747_13960 [Rapidithrix thailandica]|uniref:STAS/SEC14 domain-containing protein n=1 Tax=Rapidithrix thailandica TaxID=413964 RepID=A0AAW9S7T8_9BACT